MQISADVRTDSPSCPIIDQMDRSADMALPDSARGGKGGKSVSDRSGRIGKPGPAKPTHDEAAGGTARRGPRPPAPQEETPGPAPPRRAPGPALAAQRGQPDP